MSAAASHVPAVAPAPSATTQPILRAAAALVREHGAAFTMDQLERRTGLSRATLYRRVGGKQALLEHLAALGEAPAPARGDAHQRILLAARRVVAERGVAGATMERVAEHAGVGVATVYRHFGAREKLLTASVRTAGDRARMRDLVERANGDLRADLARIAGNALAFFSDNRDLLRLVLGANPEELAFLHALKGSSDRTLDGLTALFERESSRGHLARGAEPRRLALAFVGILLAFAVVGPEHYDIEADDPTALAELAVRLFLDGAAV